MILYPGRVLLASIIIVFLVWLVMATLGAPAWAAVVTAVVAVALFIRWVRN